MAKEYRAPPPEIFQNKDRGRPDFEADFTFTRPPESTGGPTEELIRKARELDSTPDPRPYQPASVEITHLLDQTDDKPWSDRFRAYVEESGYQPGSPVDILVDRIHENPYNPRGAPPSQEGIEKLALQLSHEGLHDPIHLALDSDAPIGEPTFILLDGHRRLRATRDVLKKRTIRAFVHDISDARSLYLFGFYSHEGHEPPSWLGTAMAWRRLLDEGEVKSQRELCEWTGYPKAKVSRILSLVDLPEPVREVVMEASPPIHERTAYELVLFHLEQKNVERTVRTARELISGELTRAGLRARRVPRSRPRSGDTRHRFVLAGKRVGNWRLNERGELKINLEGVTEEFANQLSKKVYSMLSQHIGKDDDKESEQP